MSGGNEHQHSPQRTIQQIEDITKWNIEYYIRFMIAHIDWILGGLCSASQPPSHPFLSGIRIIIDWKRALGFSKSTLGGFKRMRQRESESKWKDLKLEMKDWRELKAVTLRFHQRCHTIYFCTYPDANPQRKKPRKTDKILPFAIYGICGGPLRRRRKSNDFLCLRVCLWVRELEDWRCRRTEEGRIKRTRKPEKDNKNTFCHHFMVEEINW